MRKAVRLSAALLALTLALALPSSADVVISFYIGAAQTRPSDLHVVQSGRGNDTTIRKVPWPGYSFRFEPYYGIRLTYTSPGLSRTRLALDFTHYKTYARTEAVVAQDGTWHNSALRDVAPMRERVQSFEMTHGLNMLGLSVLQQFSASRDGVYVGGGPVIYVPHADSRVDGLPSGGRYDFGGWGFQAHAGARQCVGVRRVFAEVKYNEGRPYVAIAQGQAQTTLQTTHELVGLDFGSCTRHQ